jgi:hypothetical protein
MKDWTPILWIAGIGAVLYYGYQNNWFGTAATAPAVVPTVAPIGSGNMVPISVLTPAQPPAVLPPLYGPPINGVPPPGVLSPLPTTGGAGVILDPKFPCPKNADCSPLMLNPVGGGQ